MLGRTIGIAPGQGRRTAVTGAVTEEIAVEQVCDEVRARLLGLEHQQAVEVMQHLILAHDTLATRGWRGVDALPGRVLGRAVLQAEILATDERSPVLAHFIDRLRVAHTGARQRDDDDTAVREIRVGRDLEVTESTFAEYEDMARGWAGTVPSRLDPPAPQARHSAFD